MRCTEAIYPHCPGCGRVTRVLLWSVDPDRGDRTYRCNDCGARWSVSGVQAELFAAETSIWELRLERRS